MKIIDKILIVPIILTCLILDVTLADNTDCGIFGNLPYKQEGSESNGFSIVNSSRETNTYKFSNFLTIEEQKAILTKDDLNTALLNLKKYCCENELGGLKQNDKTCKNDVTFFNKNSLDSKYLFDHLFDVIMRRLNGLTGDNDIYTNTNMTVDDLGTERRSRITSQAENLSGANPQIIMDEYKKFWDTSPATLGYNITTQTDATFGDLSDQNFLLYVSGQGSSEDSTQTANALKKYKEWTLYDRYNNACSLTEYFYSLLDVGINSDDKVKTIKKIANGACKDAVKNQIESENKYVAVITQQSGNLFLKKYINGYTSYLYNRQKQLESLEKNVTNRFLDIVRGVPHLVKICNK